MMQRLRRGAAAPQHTVRRMARAVAFFAIFSMLAGMFATTARAEDSGPGATDPLGGPSHYAMFRSDKLFTMLPEDDSITAFSTYAPSSNLSQLSQLYDYNTNYSQSQAATSGRILSPDTDQVALARPDGNGNIELSLVNGTNGFGNYTLPNADTTSFSGKPYPLNIKAGDLDGVTDSEGHFHDEVVVAYPVKTATGDSNMAVSVLDYTNASLNNGQPTAVTTQVPPFPVCFHQSCPSIDNVTGLAVGDFDGDGTKEIALLSQTDDQHIVVILYHYTNDGRGGRLLRLGSYRTIGADDGLNSSYHFMGSLDLAAGDFNGDGKDELALAVAEQNGQNFAILLKMLDGSLLNPINTLIYNTSFNPSDYLERPRLQLVAGLFKLDQINGFGFARRQLALAFNPTSGIPIVKTFQVDSSLTLSTLYSDFAMPHVDITGPMFSLTAGGFRGNADIQNHALWPLAFAALDRFAHYTVGLINVNTDGLSAAAFNTSSGPTFNPSTWRPVVVPYDEDGKAVLLGAPLHITLQNVLNTDYVMYEPPKMAYWDEAHKTVVNVSRYSSFNVELTNEQGQDFKSTSKDTSNWTIGGSAEASAGIEGKLGGDFGLIKAGASVCAQITLKASYDYDSSKASDSSNYKTREVGVQGTTSADDYLRGRYQNIDVWRYRVYGIKDAETNTNTFYDLMLPGSALDFAGGGLGYDWYQPTHENGNILSYPRYLGPNGSNVPADLGSFTLPNGTVKTEPMIAASQQAWGGTSGHQWLKWTSDVGSGSETEYKHTINASADFKTAFKAEGGIPVFGGASVNGSLDLNVHGGASWGGATTSENSTNGSTEIRLNTALDPYDAPGSSGQGYFFDPVFYTATDGTIKVAYSVDPSGSNYGGTYWQIRFGGKPDPALNLPGRFTSQSGDDWEPNGMWSQRKMIRGFGLTSPDTTVANPNPDPITGDYPKLVYSPVDGEKVRVAVRVYNYSTDTPAQNVRVRFQAVKFNDSTLQEIGDRVNIGDTLVSLGSVNAGNQMGVAAINWDTTGFGGTVGAQEYRIYVVLNPQDNNPQYIANEIYPAEAAPLGWKPGEDADTQEEGTFDPGQNNEGFGVAYVSAKPSLSAALNSASLNPTGVDVHMKSDSLAVLEPDGTFQTQQVQVKLGKPILVRATVFSDQPSTEFNHLLLYDGDPATGGHVIADKEVFTGDNTANGASVWVQWRPLVPGTHTLYAKVLEDPSDPTKGNHFDTLQVQVPGPAYRIYVPLVSRGPGERTSTLDSAATTHAVVASNVAPAGDSANCGGSGGGEEAALASQPMQMAPEAGVVAATHATAASSAGSTALGPQLAPSAPEAGAVAATDATAAGGAGGTPWVSMGTALLGVPLAQVSLVLRRRYRRRHRGRRQG